MKIKESLREVLQDAKVNSGDTIVFFGELFPKGYGTGVEREAKRRGLNIIRTTVGRREVSESGSLLRPLNSEEASSIENLINIPLEAGCDSEPDSTGKTPTDYLKDIKISNWKEFKFDETLLNESLEKGRKRFRGHVQLLVQELRKKIPAEGNVIFAHLMAGGFPKAKIALSLMNRALRGSGDKFLSSEELWNSGVGRICDLNFKEVTAGTLQVLLDETKTLRDELRSEGRTVSYFGFGYHGTEILVDEEFAWQSYSPYLQGWAKIELEKTAQRARAQGTQVTIYNCPEILTNSSAIFSGVEVSLYPFLGALKKAGFPKIKLQALSDLMKSEFSMEILMDYVKDYLSKEEIRSHLSFEKWPQHNSEKQIATMLEASEKLFSFHKDPKMTLSEALSEVVVESCGKLIFNDCQSSQRAVTWLNHDVISKQAAKL